MIKKILLIIWGPFLIGILINSCCSPCDRNEYTKITGVKFTTQEKQILANKKLNININFDYQKYNVLNSILNSINLNNSAYACSRNCYKGMQNIITSIKVTANKAFDNDHLTGTNLNDIFNIIDNNLEQQKLNEYDLTEIDPIRYDTKQISTEAKPTLNTSFTFYIEIQLENQEIYLDSVENVVFL